MGDAKNKKITIKKNPQQAEEWDDTFKLMSWWDSEKVSKSKIMVVGAGALGNEVLKNLALMNVGHIMIVDFDTVEYANLCRSVLFREEDVGKKEFKIDVAARRIKELNPNVKTQTINGDILTDVGLGIFRRMDVIIGCLDNRLARLYINRHSFKVGKTWVNGGIINLCGQMNVFSNGHACYECMLTPMDWSHISEKMGCPDIARRNASVGRVPTTPLSSSIIAAMQVQEALKVVHGFDKQIMKDEQLRYDGLNNWYITYGYGAASDVCNSHYVITDDDLLIMKELSHKSTIGEFLAAVKSELGKDVKIKLDYNVVLKIYLSESKENVDVIIPELKFSDALQDQYRKDPRDVISFQEYQNEFDHTFDKLDIRLEQLGIPALQIITIEDEEGNIKFVELTKDEDFINFI